MINATEHNTSHTWKGLALPLCCMLRQVVNADLILAVA